MAEVDRPLIDWLDYGHSESRIPLAWNALEDHT
jgi:hypothetical protein